MNASKTIAAAALFTISACGGRPSVWDATPGSPRTQIHGLSTSVALVDDQANRVVLLVPRPDQELEKVILPIGKNVLRGEVAPDRERLFVLSSGDQPRRTERDQRAAVTVIGRERTAKRYELSAPLSGITIDPRGRWAAVYAGDDGRRGFVENPNQLVLIDLEAEPGPTNPVTTTLRSYGGRPRRVTFAPEMRLPEGPRRLLVVETDQDLSILDLDHVREPDPRPEITVRLTSGLDDRVLTPAGVVFHDGDPVRSDDARIGVRLANDSNVVTLQLAPVAKSDPRGNDFTPKVNLTDVGGVPSDLSFVQTDGGLRLAALVPSRSRAVLVEPETSVTTDVTLPAPYTKFALVTDALPPATGGAQGDVALLWNAANGRGVALWALGATSGRPYRSVEVINLGADVKQVSAVPKPRAELKILESGSAGFYVLDLSARTAAPLVTSSAVTLAVAPDGERMWAYEKAATKLASIDTRKLDPVPLVVDRPIDAVFEVERDDGGRALLAVHARGTYGVTIFDARDADSATARLHGGLLLGGL
jgi:hypothetical protein